MLDSQRRRPFGLHLTDALGGHRGLAISFFHFCFSLIVRRELVFFIFPRSVSLLMTTPSSWHSECTECSTIRENWLSFPQHQSNSKVSWLAMGPTSPLPCWLCLAWPCVYCHNSCEILWAFSLMCLENTVSLKCLPPLALTLFLTYLLRRFLNLERRGTAFSNK